MNSTPTPSPEVPTLPTAEDMDLLRRLDAVLKFFQEVSPMIGVGQMRAIIWAALQGNRGRQIDFTEHLKLSETASAGNLDYWTRFAKNKVKPPELLEKVQSIENRTQNRILLTRDGERFINHLLQRLR